MTPLNGSSHPMTEENAKCSKCAGTGQVADSVDGFVTCVGCQGTGKDYAAMSTKCGIHGCENQHENHDDDSGRRLRTDSVASMVRELPMTSHDTGKRVPSVTFGTNARGGVGLVYFCSDACEKVFIVSGWFRAAFVRVSGWFRVGFVLVSGCFWLTSGYSQFAIQSDSQSQRGDGTNELPESRKEDVIIPRDR